MCLPSSIPSPCWKVRSRVGANLAWEQSPEVTAGSHTITLRQLWCTALEVTADSALYKAQTSVLWESLVCMLHHSPSAVWEDTSALGRVACRTVTWWLMEDGVPLARNQRTLLITHRCHHLMLFLFLFWSRVSHSETQIDPTAFKFTKLPCWC